MTEPETRTYTALYLFMGAGVLLLLAAAIAAAFVIKSPAGVGVKIGQQAPDFALMNLEGRAVNLSDYRGQVTLLDFWATWCSPCRAELPYLQTLQSQYRAQGFAVVAVSLDRDASMVAPLLRANRLTLSSLLDPRNEVGRRYRVSSIPRTFILDRRGIVRHDHTGWGKSRVEELESEIRTLLSEKTE
jgi:peroxiredoxin